MIVDALWDEQWLLDKKAKDERAERDAQAQRERDAEQKRVCR